jgi:hypothetical protein
MAISNLTTQAPAPTEISLENSLFNTINHDLAPEVIAILDFLPLLDLGGENTPAGEIVDLRASMFLRNRNFVRRKFRGLFHADVGDDVPDTLETLSDNDAERKLIKPDELLKRSGFRLYRSLGKNFDYYTDTSFQAVELLFSTSEIFKGAFDKIKNYDMMADAYDLADDVSTYIPDMYYDTDSIDVSTKAGLYVPVTNQYSDLFNVVINSLDSFSAQVELGDFNVSSTLPGYFKEDSGYSTDDVINALPTHDQLERISFLFFTLGKAYAEKLFTDKSTSTSFYDIKTFVDNFKNVIGPQNNSGYNFFREESVDNEYKGYNEFLNNVFEDTIKNKKTSFDISKITHLYQEMNINMYLFINLFYYSYGFFTENKFIDNFYRKCGYIMDNIFQDDVIEELIDDLFIRILKSEPGSADGIREVAMYYDNYYRNSKYNEFDDWDSFTAVLRKDGDDHDYNNKAIKEANNHSYIFKAVKDLNDAWGNGTDEIETCILLIILNILSVAAKSDYIEIDLDGRGAKKTKYSTNLKDNIGWKISATFDNSTSNKTSNELYDDLRDIYLRCAEQHYSTLRKVAGLKSVEAVFSKAASEIGAIKYLNNEALAVAQPHSHLLLDYSYKHAFRIRQFFDLLQQHENRFTPQKFNLSKGGSYELLKSYMTEDKCKMNKKQQLNRKKKIFSIGIRNNAIKQAIKNSEIISGDYIIKLKISIEKELAVFDGIKFKPLEFEFDLSSFAALNSYEIAGLTNGDERELLFETTDDIISSTSFEQFISNNMKLVKFKNSFTTIEDFMHFDEFNDIDKTVKNGIESDILKEYVYRVYGMDLSETTFISDRKGPDAAAHKIVVTTLGNKFKNTQSLMLNKSIFFNGDKFTYEILQNSKFEKIINVLVDVENDFEVDTENLELNDWSNAYLLNDVSTADHYDFKVRSEIIIEEVG